MTIFVGDFNCRISYGAEDPVPSDGKFAHSGNTSDNGERLVLLAEERGMKVVNTFFCQNERKSTSWTHPAIKKRDLLDYFPVHANNMGKVKDVQCKHLYDCGSDHNCVVLYLKRYKTARMAWKPKTGLPKNVQKDLVIKDREYLSVQLQRIIVDTKPGWNNTEKVITTLLNRYRKVKGPL